MARPARVEGEPEGRHSGRLLLRMPATLHAELARLAQEEGVSLNQFITNALSATAAGPPGSPAERREEGRRSLRLVLLANLVAIAVATVIALALLVTALTRLY